MARLLHTTISTITSFCIRKWHLVLLILFSVLLLGVGYVLSVWRHNHFLSNAHDLGIYNQYVYKISHLKSPISTLYMGKDIYSIKPIRIMHGHVIFIFVIESFFYHLFGKNVLLYFQLSYTLLGLWGVYYLCFHISQNRLTAIIASLLFITHYSLYAALYFDYHTNTLPTMLLPWTLYFLLKQSYKPFWLLFFIAMLAREESATIYALAFIAVALALQLKKKQLLHIGLGIFAAGAYTLLAWYIICSDENYVDMWGLFYNHLGDNPKDFIKKFLQNPAHYLYLGVRYPEQQLKIKYLLYTGGIFVIFYPFLILPLLPILGITLLSNSWTRWGNMYHYNILFSVWLPFIITYVAVRWTKWLNQKKIPRAKWLMVLLPAIFLYANYDGLKKAVYFHDYKTIFHIFTKDFYNQRPNAKVIKAMIDKIPEGVAVSASGHLVPHLAFRDSIFLFPAELNADYIAVIRSDCHTAPYPFNSSEECLQAIDSLKRRKDLTLIYDKEEVLLFKKQP